MMSELYTKEDEQAVLMIMKKVIPGKFKEMLASILLYVLSYPQLSHYVGIVFFEVDPPCVLINISILSNLLDIGELLLSQLLDEQQWIKHTPTDTCEECRTGWLEYTLTIGTLFLYTRRSVHHPRYKGVLKTKLNEWNVKTWAVELILGIRKKTQKNYYLFYSYFTYYIC
jgi:hypothetical protein